MDAMVLHAPRTPLSFEDVPAPIPKGREIVIGVRACGVCRTDLHIVDGELASPTLPLILGHQVVGRVMRRGPEATRFQVGQKVGIPWLGKTCGTCSYCTKGQENLCDNALFTGYHLNGGFAEECPADERYCFPLPEEMDDAKLAPLLCAGLIGYRAYSMIEGAKTLGLYGFGASAHIIAQVAKAKGKRLFAFTRAGDTQTQAFATDLGVAWAGSSEEAPPEEMDGALIFAPVGALVPKALSHVKKGGAVVCAGIHMSDIPSFPYALLREERTVKSVANLTRQDGERFFDLLKEIPLQVHITRYPLREANQALDALRSGRIDGAAVLIF